MIGFTTYYYERPRGDRSEASALAAFDRTTLRQVAGPLLRLRDRVTSWVPSPDRSRVALGSFESGRVVLVDVPEWRATEILANTDAPADQVVVVSWPRSNLLIGYSQPYAYGPPAGKVFTLDPSTNRVTNTVLLHGEVRTAIRTDDGGAAILVSPTKRVGPSRLVLVSPDGAVTEVSLERVQSGYLAGTAKKDGDYRIPAMLASQDTVYVIGAGAPIAAVDVRNGVVTYNDVPGFMTARLPSRRDCVVGVRPSQRLSRTAVWLRPGLALVTGDESYPRKHFDSGICSGINFEFERVANVVDLEQWRVVATLRAVRDESTTLDGLILTWPNHNLTVMRADGEVLFTRRTQHRRWLVVDDRLVEIRVGNLSEELHLQTGRVIRSLGETTLNYESPRPFRWPMKRGEQGENPFNPR